MALAQADGIAGDDSLRLQPPDPRLRRRAGDAERAGQLRHRAGAVGLKGREDLLVERIHDGSLRHFAIQIGKSASIAQEMIKLIGDFAALMPENRRKR